jgi:hypothetical protein
MCFTALGPPQRCKCQSPPRARCSSTPTAQSNTTPKQPRFSPRCIATPLARSSPPPQLNRDAAALLPTQARTQRRTQNAAALRVSSARWSAVAKGSNTFSAKAAAQSSMPIVLEPRALTQCWHTWIEATAAHVCMCPRPWSEVLREWSALGWDGRAYRAERLGCVGIVKG